MNFNQLRSDASLTVPGPDAPTGGVAEVGAWFRDMVRGGDAGRAARHETVVVGEDLAVEEL
jgi:hypothetical protein